MQRKADRDTVDLEPRVIRPRSEATQESPPEGASGNGAESSFSAAEPNAQELPVRVAELNEEQVAPAASDLDSQRKKRAEQKAAAKEAKAQSDLRVEQAMHAAPAKSDDAPAKKPQSEDFSVPANDAAREQAETVIKSSKAILQSYKQPEGMHVDLGLAQFSLDTAERLAGQARFAEAFEKASAVGMLVAMSEMRAAIEGQLKEFKSNAAHADKLKAVRAILSEADRSMAEASKSFVSDESSDTSFMSQLQTAFQKTTEAQTELMKAKV